MKTLEQLRTEHAATEAKLCAELELAAAAQFTPDSVQINASLAPWLVYRKRTLAEALAMFKASPVVPFSRFKGTFTSLSPAACAKPNAGEEVGGPFAVELDVNQGEGFGPSVTLSFFTMAGDRICRAKISIEGPDYVGAFHALGATPREQRDARTGRLESRTFIRNGLLNGLSDDHVGWASGDQGPVKTSAQSSYLFMADRDETAPGADNAHACGQLQNLIDATAPFPRIVSQGRRTYWEVSPGVFNATESPDVRPAENGAGYADLDALKRLKGDA